MMIKKFSIITVFIITSLLLVTLASATTPIVKYDPKNEIINTSDITTPAVYNFTIINPNSNPERYQLYTISAFWDINPTIINVAGSSNETFDLEVRLLSNNLQGQQLVPITIKSLSSKDSVVEYLNVNIHSANTIVQTYVPNVAMDITMKDEIDPRDPISIEVYMRNKNLLDIKDLKISVDSNLFSKEYMTTLAPLEEKTNQILFIDLNKIQEPGTYKININLITQNKTIATVQKEVRVIGY